MIKGLVKAVIGDVKVLRLNGDRVSLIPGAMLEEGDVLISGKGSAAEVEFSTQGGQPTKRAIIRNEGQLTVGNGEGGNMLSSSSGEVEVLAISESVEDSVSSSGGMFGLFGGGLTASNIGYWAPAGLVGLGLTVIGAEQASGLDDDEPTPPPASEVPVAANVSGAEGLGPLESSADSGASALINLVPQSGAVVDGLAPVLEASAPVTSEAGEFLDSFSSVLTPVDNAVIAAIESFDPVIEMMVGADSPLADLQSIDATPLTDGLLTVTTPLAEGLSTGAVPLADGIAQFNDAVIPQLSPLTDQLDALSKNFDLVFDAVATTPNDLGIVGGAITSIATIDPTSIPSLIMPAD